MANITLIGLDVGTTATKAVLIDEAGSDWRRLRIRMRPCARRKAMPNRTRATGWPGCWGRWTRFRRGMI
ncbi:hypothetical protein N8D56_09755 [Devosia sp. A8/3-2]|nr:hypothetical protein N8D56_09755 [Devosia sp. A8/3-2]